MKAARRGEAAYPVPEVGERIVSLSPVKWEFDLIEQKRWTRCSPTEKGFVQGAMNAALNEIEARRAKPNGTERP